MVCMPDNESTHYRSHLRSASIVLKDTETQWAQAFTWQNSIGVIEVYDITKKARERGVRILSVLSQKHSESFLW